MLNLHISIMVKYEYVRLNQIYVSSIFLGLTYLNSYLFENYG